MKIYETSASYYFVKWLKKYIITFSRIGTEFLKDSVFIEENKIISRKKFCEKSFE